MLGNVPVRSLPVAPLTVEHVHPCDVVQLILPEAWDWILYNSLEVAAPVPIWSTNREFFTAPLAKKHHRPLATELPALSLDTVVRRRPQQLEHDALRQPCPNPAVFFGNHFEVATAQARDAVGYTFKCLFPGNHPELGVLVDGCPSRSKAVVACLDLALCQIRKPQSRLAPTARPVFSITCVQSVRCPTMRAFAHNRAPNV